jgi:hypothetical protein
MDAVAVIQEVTSKLVEDAKKMVLEEEAAGGAEAWARDYLNGAYFQTPNCLLLPIPRARDERLTPFLFLPKQTQTRPCFGTSSRLGKKCRPRSCGTTCCHCSWRGTKPPRAC